MNPDQPGGGNFFTNRIMGVPVFVWIGGIAILAYLYFRHTQQQNVPATTSGGGGQLTTGNTTLQKGAIHITVNAAHGDDDDQPKPHGHGKSKKITVPNEVGKTYAAGARDLKAHGLQAHRTHPYIGRTIAEAPKSGAKVPKGSTVTLSGHPKVPPRRGHKPHEPKPRKRHWKVPVGKHPVPQQKG